MPAISSIGKTQQEIITAARNITSQPRIAKNGAPIAQRGSELDVILTDKCKQFQDIVNHSKGILHLNTVKADIKRLHEIEPEVKKVLTKLKNNETLSPAEQAILDQYTALRAKIQKVTQVKETWNRLGGGYVNKDGDTFSAKEVRQQRLENAKKRERVLKLDQKIKDMEKAEAAEAKKAAPPKKGIIASIVDAFKNQATA